jgi:hypothetical protein
MLFASLSQHGIKSLWFYQMHTLLIYHASFSLFFLFYCHHPPGSTENKVAWGLDVTGSAVLVIFVEELIAF